ncbi:MAG: aminopeptidase P family N-terminal domain-containing protein, partial [Lachnospiraceae bacterium]|nr:aminopeptidase P family N-terminal domain-containing protein [Lachnospiraceae bacterium]
MIQRRLQLLRQQMKEHGVTVYIVPSSDCHESEYVSRHFRAREYITGFTGSAGTAVITMEEAGLWTDGRYFIQAERQLAGSGITLYRTGEPGVPKIQDYLKEHLKKGEMLGFDGRVMGAEQAEEYVKAARDEQADILVTKDLIGEIWTDRPDIPDAAAWILEECWSGESAGGKLSRVRTEMEKLGADVHVLASLCDIAWLLNLRGNDIPGVPVTLSFLRITKDTCTWYVRSGAVTEEVRIYLQDQHIQIKPYDEIYKDMELLESGQKLLLDKQNVNYRLLSSIPKEISLLNQSNPTEQMKAVKNPTEIANTRKAHLKESITFTKFMYWLKMNVGKHEITEVSAAEYLNAFRQEQEHYLEESFAPICAYGPHGAIVHYSATEESNVRILPEGFLLVDAGGHYLEGTTDTTRTIAMGVLTDEQKRMFTIICRCNLNLANAHFLYGCSGYSLDALCRQPLWQMNLDYKHGTGHGVGHLLNVHEGPNGFRWKHPQGNIPAVLEEGMITTDEPG